MAFVVIVLCGIYIALHARETFGTMLAAGITMLIGLQAAINIGVVTSALPNKGLSLPFISYGGSNLLAMLTCVGILLTSRGGQTRRRFPRPISLPKIIPILSPPGQHEFIRGTKAFHRHCVRRDRRTSLSGTCRRG